MGYIGNSPTPTPIQTSDLADGLVTIAKVGSAILPADKRQTVLTSAVDSSGYCALLSAGAGLNFNVEANPVSAVVSFASGYGTKGAPQDFITTLSADAANQGSLNASNTSFIHATRASDTTVTWGSTLVPPQYGYAFDRAQGALLNFEGTNTSTTMLDDFGNTWTASGNAQISTAQKQFGTSSLALDGTGDFVTTNNLTTFGDSSWEISCWVRWNVLPTAGTSQVVFLGHNGVTSTVYLLLNNTAGTTKLQISASADGSTSSIANAVFGTNTTWATGTWYKMRMVFDALAGTYKVYLSVAGAAESTDISVSSSAKVCASTLLRIGADSAGTSALNGWVDAFRFVRGATNTSAETPSVSAPAIGDYPYHWFSIPEMKMYEVTSASGVAGVNPGMTQRVRAFVGEQDTNASAVTATRNYAIRGQYTSDEFTLTVSTLVTKNHNIGVKPTKTRFTAVNRTSEFGFNPGEDADVFFHFDSVDGRGGSVSNTRNVVSFSQGGRLSVVAQKAGGTVQGITYANWKGRLEIDRGW